jgi:hypothetical protein
LKRERGRHFAIVSDRPTSMTVQRSRPLLNVPDCFGTFHDGFLAFLVFKRSQTVENAHGTFRNFHGNVQEHSWNVQEHSWNVQEHSWNVQEHSWKRSGTFMERSYKRSVTVNDCNAGRSVTNSVKRSRSKNERITVFIHNCPVNVLLRPHVFVYH